ncbi:MAG: metal-sensitive transcriptional regulator [Betaproteobacteria bacterium]|nr:metal-sensitive transcriptional regulator [Betaproteobacteria bacterium]MDE2621669.1 metal-sensitive transcriptional regulator [Betaproteobacteria bacterium]
MTSKPEARQLCHPSDPTVVQPHKQALLNRLNRIAGQVRGISGMIEGDRYCIDILTQVSAIQSALDAVALQLIEDHTKGCVQKAVRQGDGDAAISELMGVLRKISR